MKVGLHPNLGALVPLASKEATRFATGAVRILVKDDGAYLVETTDGRILGRVTGTSLNGGEPGDILLEAKPFAESCKGARKAKGNETGLTIEQVTANSTPVKVSYGSTTEHLSLQEGCWPRTDEVFPRPPVISFTVNPDHFIRVLRAASDIIGGDPPHVTIEFHSPDVPIAVRGKNPVTGQEFHGLISPLAGPS